MNSNYPYSNAILRRRFFILLAMLLAALGGMPGLAVTFTNQMDASLVLGKSNFTGSAAASPAASLKSPAFVLNRRVPTPGPVDMRMIFVYVMFHIYSVPFITLNSSG